MKVNVDWQGRIHDAMDMWYRNYANASFTFVVHPDVYSCLCNAVDLCSYMQTGSELEFLTIHGVDVHAVRDFQNLTDILLVGRHTTILIKDVTKE